MFYAFLKIHEQVRENCRKILEKFFDKNRFFVILEEKFSSGGLLYLLF